MILGKLKHQIVLHRVKCSHRCTVVYIITCCAICSNGQLQKKSTHIDTAGILIFLSHSPTFYIFASLIKQKPWPRPVPEDAGYWSHSKFCIFSMAWKAWTSNL